jgi:hypothetical protein
MRLARPLLVCFFAVVPTIPSWAAEVGQRFPGVQAFIESMPQGSANVQAGYGDLAGVGRRNWAAVVTFQDPEIGSARQLVVLAQQADGSYQVAAQGPVQSTNGGTGHHGLDAVRIKQGSVLVSWSWNWHGCGGGSSQQIKFYKNQWRVIGAEFNRAASIDTPQGYDAGDAIRISHNLLTGAVVVRLQPAQGKPQTMNFKNKPSVVLLDDGFDEDTGGTEEYASYASC